MIMIDFALYFPAFGSGWIFRCLKFPFKFIQRSKAAFLSSIRLRLWVTY